MPPFYSFSQKTTSISFAWPKEVTGLERIALAAQGDLQKVLSAFFARPIVVALVYANTSISKAKEDPPSPLALPNSDAIEAASPGNPIWQTRQVHLQCAGRIVCTATSTVRMSSSHAATLFLEEKYAIGQTFQKLQQPPIFELLEVGFGLPKNTNTKGLGLDSHSTDITSGPLWRRYSLAVEEFECDIVEVFPSRDMFRFGEAWLADSFMADRHALWKPTFFLKHRDLLASCAIIMFLGLFLFQMAFLFYRGGFLACS